MNFSIEGWDTALSLVSNFLTAAGILGLFLWWINRCRVKIYIRVPDFPGVNWRMLYIRDGGEGSKIENKIHAFKTLGSKNKKEEIISITISCNPRLGFQFKCFAELPGNEKQKKEMYPEFKQKLKDLGFHSISPLAYDGKVWFLLPDEYLFGQIRASLVENITNNIWYPTLARTIYPYHSIIAKVPIKYEDNNVFDHSEYFLEVEHKGHPKEELFFGTLKRNEEENYALIKASIKILPGFKPFKFKSFSRIIGDKEDVQQSFEALERITIDYKKHAKEKLAKAMQEFKSILDQDKITMPDENSEKAIQLIGELKNELRKGKDSYLQDIEIAAEFEDSIEKFVERNKTEKSFPEYIHELKAIAASFDFKYDIKALKIADQKNIEIEFDEHFNFQKDGDHYVWNADIKSQSLLGI